MMTSTQQTCYARKSVRFSTEIYEALYIIAEIFDVTVMHFSFAEQPAI